MLAKIRIYKVVKFHLELFQARSELRPAGLHVFQQAVFVEGPRHRHAGRARQRVPAVSGRVVPGPKHVGAFFAEHGADGHPPTEGFGAGEHVRLHVQVLETPQFAGAPHPRLHLNYARAYQQQQRQRQRQAKQRHQKNCTQVMEL